MDVRELSALVIEQSEERRALTDRVTQLAREIAADACQLDQIEILELCEAANVDPADLHARAELIAQRAADAERLQQIPALDREIAEAEHDLARAAEEYALAMQRVEQRHQQAFSTLRGLQARRSQLDPATDRLRATWSTAYPELAAREKELLARRGPIAQRLRTLIDSTERGGIHGGSLAAVLSAKASIAAAERNPQAHPAQLPEARGRLALAEQRHQQELAELARLRQQLADLDREQLAFDRAKVSL